MPSGRHSAPLRASFLVPAKNMPANITSRQGTAGEGGESIVGLEEVAVRSWNDEEERVRKEGKYS